MPSEHCLAILNEPYSPELCADLRKKRALVMCLAWDKMNTEHKTFKDAVKEAWGEVKGNCGVINSGMKTLEVLKEYKPMRLG